MMSGRRRHRRFRHSRYNVTARAEALFNKARLAQKYCGGGRVVVTISSITGTGILSDISKQNDLESGGFIQGIDAELHVRKCDYPTAPTNGSTLTTKAAGEATATTYRITDVNNDHRMGEWVLTLQAQHR